ncbi:MAG: right-handed parallel beta-helix repeat-containing protein [Candidatus Acidiferrales bacterium]
MTRPMLFLFFALGVSIPVAAVMPGAAEAANQVVVGTKSATCNAQYPTIQAGVDAAAPGGTVRICPGVYKEQVTIAKAVTLRGENAVVIEPARVTANATGTASGQPIAAIVLVKDTTDVDIDNVIVDGTNNGITGCSPDLVGLFYQNASGEVNHVAVRNVMLNPSLNGCQSGDAILVQSGGGEMSVVNVQNSSIHDYQKNGITANESGTQVQIDHNVITGIGPTTGAVQNGIQIGFGATGSITKNTIANNVWSTCTSLQSCDNTATGILVFQSDNVTVQHNKEGVAQVGIAINGTHAQVERNQVSGSMVADGIELIGTDNDAQTNTITHSDRAAIFISGNDNVVQQNTINEAAFGVLKVSGSDGNVINNNKSFNTAVEVQDPAGAGSKLSPYR